MSLPSRDAQRTMRWRESIAFMTSRNEPVNGSFPSLECPEVTPRSSVRLEIRGAGAHEPVVGDEAHRIVEPAANHRSKVRGCGDMNGHQALKTCTCGTATTENHRPCIAPSSAGRATCPPTFFRTGRRATVLAILILSVAIVVASLLAVFPAALVGRVRAVLDMRFRCASFSIFPHCNRSGLVVRIAFLATWILARDVADWRRRRIDALRLKRYGPEASGPCLAEPEASDPCRGDDAPAGALVSLTPDIALTHIVIARRETEAQNNKELVHFDSYPESPNGSSGHHHDQTSRKNATTAASPVHMDARGHAQGPGEVPVGLGAAAWSNPHHAVADHGTTHRHRVDRQGRPEADGALSSWRTQE